MELRATRHEYYCETEVSSKLTYATWQDFKDEWGPDPVTQMPLDQDYNHIFRYDLIQVEDDDGSGEALPGKFELRLFFMLQRKGRYLPVVIENIKEEDMEQITEFLEGYWEYMKGQWSEFSSK